MVFREEIRPDQMWTIVQRRFDFSAMGVPVGLRIDRCPDAVAAADEWEPMIRIVGPDRALYVRSCKTYGRDPISHGLSIISDGAADPEHLPSGFTVRNLRITPRQNQSMKALLLSLSGPEESGGLIEKIEAHDLWPGERVEQSTADGPRLSAVVVQDGIVCAGKEFVGFDELAYALTREISLEAQSRARVVTIRFANTPLGALVGG